MKKAFVACVLSVVLFVSIILALFLMREPAIADISGQYSRFSITEKQEITLHKRDKLNFLVVIDNKTGKEYIIVKGTTWDGIAITEIDK